MISRERVFNAIKFQPVDKIPLEYHPSKRGLYEHGERLNLLFKGLPGDFEDYADQPIPMPLPTDFDEDGRYHSFKTDEWGVKWEYRIFEMTGHPAAYPLGDWGKLDEYVMPPPLFSGQGEFDALKCRIASLKAEGRFVKKGFFGIFERLHSLRKFEDVLMDMMDDSPEINRLADMITDYNIRGIETLCRAGVDAIGFGDDYGTGTGQLISPSIFRSFLVPRLKRMADVAIRYGVKLHFHSCGKVFPFLEDFKAIGVDSIWPQLTAYHANEFAAYCKDVGLAVALHIDRAGIMTYGTPEDVRREIKRLVEAFKPYEGGSWFYVEIDNGFPFENIEALIDSISKYR